VSNTAKKIDDVSDELLVRARKLVVNLENGNTESIESDIDELTRLRESDLFQELGKLTRQLHESLNNFEVDSKITNITESEIPDAKARLNHVISMTENAANKTMDALDSAMPISEKLEKRSQEIHEEWSKFRSREMSVDDFRKMSKKLDKFFPEIKDASQSMHSYMNDIMMAQDFQDLTGQIIRKVINLVQEVEDSLVELIKLSGKKTTEEEVKEISTQTSDSKGHGPQVPGIDHGSTVDSQDDVDELLSSLGF